jgi:hypothetical protein
MLWMGLAVLGCAAIAMFRLRGKTSKTSKTARPDLGAVSDQWIADHRRER